MDKAIAKSLNIINKHINQSEVNRVLSELITLNYDSEYTRCMLIQLQTLLRNGALIEKELMSPNQRRVYDIATVQDRLVEMDFIHAIESGCPEVNYMYHIKSGITIKFYRDWLYVNELGRFHYTNSNWQEELINKVKELVNE